jgi:ribosome maturation factor RimP
MKNNFLLNIEQIVTGLGFECVHVGIKSDCGKLRLQILIDTLGGINVDDCELVSRRINKFLDSEAEIPELDKGRYYLEVSSPGIERPLYKLEDYVRIRLLKPIDGRKTFTGEILGVESGNVKLSCGNDERLIPFADIKGANLTFRFNDEHEHSKGRKKS